MRESADWSDVKSKSADCDCQLCMGQLSVPLWCMRPLNNLDVLALTLLTC